MALIRGSAITRENTYHNLNYLSIYIYIYIDDFPENSSFSKNAKRPDEQMNNEHLHYKKAINGKKQIFRT